jgi:hypothetical protein
LPLTAAVAAAAEDRSPLYCSPQRTGSAGHAAAADDWVAAGTRAAHPAVPAACNSCRPESHHHCTRVYYNWPAVGRPAVGGTRVPDREWWRLWDAAEAAAPSSGQLASRPAAAAAAAIWAPT